MHILGWKTGLDNMPWQARGFYSVIGAAVLLGLGIDWSPIDPIKARYWSAVLNGVIAVPMMAALMFVASSEQRVSVTLTLLVICIEVTTAFSGAHESASLVILSTP